MAEQWEKMNQKRKARGTEKEESEEDILNFMADQGMKKKNQKRKAD